jgi:uncharacterized protein YecE (DUF72 family)
VKGRAFVGTSGWNYKHWRGTIYETGFPQRRWLERIAQHFDAVEVNTSFYRIPSRETVEAWERGTPASFVFALKLWRGITHYRKLKNAGDLTKRFLESAEGLPEPRRAPLLIQLPPNQGLDASKLERYIADFRALTPTSWSIAVEFRNDAWLQPEVYEMLDRLSVALCIHDMAGRGATENPNNAPFIYIRRHGSSDARYAGSYSPQKIAHDAGRIRQWTLDGRNVYVYYNNDIGGHAYRNAIDLRAALLSQEPR